MSSATPFLPLGLSALAASEARESAKLREQEGDIAAEMEDLAVMQRETDRKLALAKSIGAARAKAGASGIDTNTGSPLSVINEMISDERRDTQRDQFNADIAAQSQRYRAAAEAGNIRGASGISLIRSGLDTLSAAPAKKKKGEIQ